MHNHPQHQLQTSQSTPLPLSPNLSLNRHPLSRSQSLQLQLQPLLNHHTCTSTRSCASAAHLRSNPPAAPPTHPPPDSSPAALRPPRPSMRPSQLLLRMPRVRVGRWRCFVDRASRASIEAWCSNRRRGGLREGRCCVMTWMRSKGKTVVGRGGGRDSEGCFRAVVVWVVWTIQTMMRMGDAPSTPLRTQAIPPPQVLSTRARAHTQVCQPGTIARSGCLAEAAGKNECKVSGDQNCRQAEKAG